MTPASDNEPEAGDFCISSPIYFFTIAFSRKKCYDIWKVMLGCVPLKAGNAMQPVKMPEQAPELNDVYDAQRRPTGRLHRRGSPWKPGEYGLIVCVWVYDGRGKFLLTRRSPEKTFAGTWENSGGAAKAGETSRQAIARELWEETGIQARPEDFTLLCRDSDRNTHYDFYCLKHPTPLAAIRLQQGETDGCMWASYGKIRWMIHTGRICRIIGSQFFRQESLLKAYNVPKFL